MSLTVSTNKNMMMLDPQVMRRLLPAASRELPYRELVKIHQHLERINPHFKSDVLAAREQQKASNETQAMNDKARLKHWKLLVNKHRGQTVYVSDSYGIRQVTIHGPAHTPAGTTLKGYVEVRDDGWFRIHQANAAVQSFLNLHKGRMIQRSKESFVVRTVAAEELHLENPFKDELPVD